MTIREAVADGARWLDTIKPGWEMLIPLTPGALKMGSCGDCVAGHVFKTEANFHDDTNEGWPKTYTGYDIFLNMVPISTFNASVRAFQSNVPADMWREEIIARLAKWEPSQPATARQPETVEA